MTADTLDGNSLFLERRQSLLSKIKEEHPDKKGVLLLLSGYEGDREVFFQESSFLYLTGLQEPAVMLHQTYDETATLFEPNYSVDRSTWLPDTYDEEFLATVGVTEFQKMGASISGYSTGPTYTKEQLEKLIAQLQKNISDGCFIFTPQKDVTLTTTWVLEQLKKYIPNLDEKLIDCSPQIAELRRKKSTSELEYLYHAVEITSMGQQAAAGVIRAGNRESDVQAAIEYVFTESHAVRAFTSIVGSGVNSTILHYIDNKAALDKNDLVVVDIGASFNHYSGDITRTYPVSGTFSDRQKEIYNLVLETQEYIVSKAKPGMWLRNPKMKEQSLNCLAVEFLKERGYDKYFPHGIGHYIGLDTHDVGTYETPLQVGDVFTIEPGIYIRQESLGVRIEDMYWVVDDGVVCLSESIPKTVDEIEKFMKDSALGE